MSVVIPVSAEWLTLREDADARLALRALALQAAEMVRAPLTSCTISAAAPGR